MSLTQRSLAHLKALGYQAKVVEKWNPFAKIRQDLFGADVLALKRGAPVLVIQATTGANHVSRRTKLEASGFTALWTGAGAVLEIWSWKKAGPRGQRKTWTLRRERLTEPLATTEGDRDENPKQATGQMHGRGQGAGDQDPHESHSSQMPRL
jgi:hypothetical protein